MCVYLFKPHTIQLSQHYYLHFAEIETVAEMFGDLLKTTILPRLEAGSLKSSLCFCFSKRISGLLFTNFSREFAN